MGSTYDVIEEDSGKMMEGFKKNQNIDHNRFCGHVSESCSPQESRLLPLFPERDPVDSGQVRAALWDTQLLQRSQKGDDILPAQDPNDPSIIHHRKLIDPIPVHLLEC